MSTATMTRRRTFAAYCAPIPPDREADLLAAGEMIAARGEAVTVRTLALEARISHGHACTIRARLLAAGRWPWPIAPSGWATVRKPKRRTPEMEAKILDAVAATGGREGDYLLGVRVGCGRETVRRVRLDLIAAGRWPLPAPGVGVTRAAIPAAEREAQVLAAAVALGGRVGDRAIAARVGCGRSTVQHVRQELTAAGRWPFATGEEAAGEVAGEVAISRMAEAEVERDVTLRAELSRRIAAIQAETFAGQVHPPKDDEANSYDYRRPPMPPRESPAAVAEREREERRELVAGWVRDWKRSRRERRGTR